MIWVKKSGRTTPKISTAPINTRGGRDSHGLTCCFTWASGLSMKINVKKFLTIAYTKKQSRNITMNTIHHLPEIINDLNSMNSVMNNPEGGMATMPSKPPTMVML